MATRYGGHEYSFIDSNLERYTCHTICTRILRDPHITKCCGQHFCESCLNYWLTERRRESCPHCRAEGENFQHFLDKKLKREIDSLRIHCTKEGCQWIGELGSLKDHLESLKGCGYVRVKCPNGCQVKVRRKRLSNHLKNDCSHRPYQCEHCGIVDTYENITGGYYENYEMTMYGCHYNTCPEFPQECHTCGKKGIRRRKMEAHNRHCQEELVECPYKCIITQRQPAYEPLFYQPLLVLEYENTKVKRKDLDKHKSKCLLRPFKCEHCGKQDTYTAIMVHYDECCEFRVECPNRCGEKFIKRKDMRDHRSQCPQEWIECPFKEVGCKLTFQRHKSERHMLSNQKQHHRMIRELKWETARTKEENSRVHREKSTLRHENSQLREENFSLSQQVSRLKKKLKVANTTARQEYTENEPALKMIKTMKVAKMKMCRVLKVIAICALVLCIIGYFFM